MRRGTIALVLAWCALTTPQAGAVTLMVNGNTPSQRWQRVADRALVPTPEGVVSLYLASCPGSAEDAGCIDDSASPPAIWLTPDDPNVMRDAEFHELGHLFDSRYMTFADRERFRRIWHRPRIGWWDELRPFDPAASVFVGDGTMGEPSAAAEWFAQSYGWCATHRARDPDMHWDDIYDLGYIIDSVGPRWADEVEAYRRAVRSCRLIRGVARRAGL